MMVSLDQVIALIVRVVENRVGGSVSDCTGLMDLAMHAVIVGFAFQVGDVGQGLFHLETEFGQLVYAMSHLVVLHAVLGTLPLLSIDSRGILVVAISELRVLLVCLFSKFYSFNNHFPYLV